MSPTSIAHAYDQIADRWLDDRFSRTDGVAFHVRALAFLPADMRGAALSVGCGCNTRFNALIRERGLAPQGIDVSPRMVALARAADPDWPVELADACTWQPPHAFAFISAWDSLWHVPLARQRTLMHDLMAWLQPGGVLLFTAGGLDAPSEHTDRCMGPEVGYATLGVPGLLDVVRDNGMRCRHLEFDQQPQNHLVVIVQRPA